MFCKKYKSTLSLLVFFLLFIQQCTSTSYDLTLVGSIAYLSGIERIPITVIDMLKDTLKINHYPTKYITRNNINPEVLAIINNPDKTPGTVALLTDQIWLPNYAFYQKMPNTKIKLAYSMIESTQIPREWVDILNKNFDAVIVPDEWLIQVYTSSGVRIPIFVLPLPLYLEDFLKKPIKKYIPARPFTFGTSAACSRGKNLELLIDAFKKEFGSNPHVQLVIHSRGGAQFEHIKIKIAQLASTNIRGIFRPIAHEYYVHFMSNIDCYVQISQGEGYSITPREALALGKPCILSNNTAHTTICNTGFVRNIHANKQVSAYYDTFGQHVGHKFDCELADVCAALRDVYTNYTVYTQKAELGRVWVQKYLRANLKLYYLTLIKPQKVVLSNVNNITPGVLTTNSKILYQKYTT